MNYHRLLTTACLSFMLLSACKIESPDFETVYGYAGLNGGTTGGAGADAVEVAVCNGAELLAALNNPEYASVPLTIWVDGTVTPHNSNADSIPIVRSNLSIVGRGADAGFWGIGLDIRDGASNIVIRNLKLHEVPQFRGTGDLISLDGRNGPVRNIWIDHNELYNNLAVEIPENFIVPPGMTLEEAQAVYRLDYFDELVSGRGDVSDITISFNNMHDSWKTSLWGSSDEDNFNRRVTFHHNLWENVSSRLPLYRFGEAHVYNNHYSNVTTSGINSRMGAVVRVEKNFFENTRNPVLSQDSIAIGFWELIGNRLGDGILWEPSSDGIVADEKLRDNRSTGALTLPQGYKYKPSLISAKDVEKYVRHYAGTGVIETPPPALVCEIPEFDVPPKPPLPQEVPSAPPGPGGVAWNVYSGAVAPFTAGSISLASGAPGAFSITGASNAAEFTAATTLEGNGVTIFNSTAAASNSTRARITNITRNDGVYPKYFTFIAGVRGLAAGAESSTRVLEFEAAFGDAAPSSIASRLKVILRSDGSNQGVQLENAIDGQSVNAFGYDMSEYRVYHFTVTLANANTGWVRVYLDGSPTPTVNFGGQMRSVGSGSNYLTVGDGGSNRYHGLIDWIVWTDQGAWSPAQLQGLLPPAETIGCLIGYGSTNTLGCDFNSIN
ncbi:MAG TPA: pectate lyase [Gammaproteobacteria bacterium]|nr:pectate lyase [Gammaproteobacteria bacterium]